VLPAYSATSYFSTAVTSLLAHLSHAILLLLLPNLCFLIHCQVFACLVGWWRRQGRTARWGASRVGLRWAGCVWWRRPTGGLLRFKQRRRWRWWR
jgi:hypothetical protein